MWKTPKFLLISSLIAANCWGQSQVAIVSSQSAFTMRGVHISPSQGVPSWPALAGDTITAGHSPVTLPFADGSIITLNPGAEATMDLSGQTPVFHLTKGTAQYSLKTLSSVRVVSGTQTLTVTSLTGTLGRGGTGIWTPTHTAWGMVGAGAATGLGVGVSQATSGGSSVSPSH